MKKAFATLATCARAAQRVRREVRGHARGDGAASGRRDRKSYVNRITHYEPLGLGVLGSCLPSPSVTGNCF